MKTIEASGKIEKGKLQLYNEDVFKQAISDVGFVTHAHITIEYGNKRTIDQNSYLFGGVIEPIRARLYQDGYDFTAYQCYKYLENRFSKTVKRNEKTGTRYHAVKPLKELSTEEWDDIVIGDIRSWADQDLGIYCKLPHEYYEMDISAYNEWKAGEITKKQAMQKTKELRKAG